MNGPFLINGKLSFFTFGEEKCGIDLGGFCEKIEPLCDCGGDFDAWSPLGPSGTNAPFVRKREKLTMKDIQNERE